jgi:hypothetical protein
LKHCTLISKVKAASFMGLRCNVVHAKDCDAAKLFEPADEYLAKRVPGSTVDMPGVSRAALRRRNYSDFGLGGTA